MHEQSSPKRRSPDGNATELPTLEKLSVDDTAYLRAMLGWAETGSMFQGRYVEVHVASVLGAQLPTTGTSQWDMVLPGDPEVRIEVKATTARGTFKLDQTKKNATLWVFVIYEHEAKTRRPHGFRYAVMRADELPRQKTVTAGKLDSPGRFTNNASTLREQVLAKSGAARGRRKNA